MQYDNFGKFLRQKREAMGVSLNKFAINNFIEPATLSRIETQKQDLKFSVLANIALGFNLTISELVKEYELNINKI